MLTYAAASAAPPAGAGASATVLGQRDEGERDSAHDCDGGQGPEAAGTQLLALLVQS